MLATCAVIGFLLTLIWIQKYYLDHIIVTDPASLKPLTPHPPNAPCRH